MTATRLLLTPELRAKVEAVVEACYVKAEKHYKQKFPRPEIRYDIRNTNGGEAWLKRNLIRFNLTFLLENEEHFLRTTAQHEPAHLIAHFVYDKKPMNGKKVRPHGKEWQEVMALFDLTPPKEFVKHSYDLTSLDLHARPRKRRLKTTKAKLQDIMNRIGKLEEDDRLALYSMLRDEELL